MGSLHGEFMDYVEREGKIGSYCCEDSNYIEWLEAKIKGMKAEPRCVLLPLAHAAKELGVNRSVLHRLIRRGALASMKSGKLVLIDLKDAREAMDTLGVGHGRSSRRVPRTFKSVSAWEKSDCSRYLREKKKREAKEEADAEDNDKV